MRELAAARHIGKLVLKAEPSLPKANDSKVSGRWIVTGGMGALGAMAGIHHAVFHDFHPSYAVDRIEKSGQPIE